MRTEPIMDDMTVVTEDEGIIANRKFVLEPSHGGRP